MKRTLSEAQSRALYERETPYTEAHRNSYVARFERPSHERRDFGAMVHRIRKASSDEVPPRIHSHDIGEGGTPEWTPEFARYITASSYATDPADGTTYRTAFRRCLDSMATSSDEVQRRRADIVFRVVWCGMRPMDAAAASLEPADACWAKVVAEDAITVFNDNLTDMRLDLRQKGIAEGSNAA